MIGTVGRLHSLVDQRLTRLDGPESFRRFAAPGHEKLAMSLRTEDAGAAGCTLVLEHRTQAVDASARRGLAVLAAHQAGRRVHEPAVLRAVRKRAEGA